jgi:hypothetical protein
MIKFKFLLALLAFQSLSFGQTTAVPGSISYQGRVYTPAGALVGAGTPVNRTVIFRIWDSPSATAVGNLLYSETQTVTISEGEFSVLVGNGVANTTQTFGFSETAKHSSASPVVALADVFNGSNRYLSVTVANAATISTADAEISPRQQIVSSAFAFRSKFAETLGTSTSGSSLRVLDNGNIGVGNASPPSTFTVTGANSSNAAAPQLLITATDTNERLRLGVNDGGNGTGFIQSWKEGTGAQNLTLNSEGGNVGIGTSSPGNKLTLVTSSLTDGIKSTGNSGSWNLLSPGMGAGGFNGIVTLNDNALIFSGGAVDTGGLVLAPWATVTGGLRMDNTGKIGIGKSAPGSNLDVQGFTSYRGNPYTIASFAANATLAPLNITQGNSGGNPAISAGKNSAGFFDSLGFMTSDLERVKITGGGAVGIGTSSPTSILQVNGLLDVRGTTLTDGYVRASPGTALNAGYMAWHKPGDVRLGYMGWDTANVNLNLENGANFTVTNGKFGVGNSSPNVKFTLNNEGANSLPAVTGTTPATGTMMRLNGSSGLSLDIGEYGGNGAWLQTSNGVGYQYLYPLLLNPSGGGVGVGTTNLSQGTLSVAGSITSIGSRLGSLGYVRMYYSEGGAAIFDVVNTSQAGLTASRGFSYDGDSNLDWRSDRRLKKDIVDAEPMLARLMQLPFRRFRWNDGADPRHEFGVIAQEVEPLFPDLIGKSPDGMLTVGYTSFATIACKSIQELNQKMEDKIAQLETKLSEKEAETAALEARLSALENLINSSR